MRAQSSMDTLLVMGFVLVVSAVVLLPYVENQALTNSSLTAKLMILPFLERNASPLKISLIEPRASGTALFLVATTRGDMDSALQSSILAQAPCADICIQIRQNGPYSSADFTWIHVSQSGNVIPICSNTSCS